MAEIDDAVAVYRASKYSGSGNWLDESGNSYDMAPTGSPVFNNLGNESYWQYGTSNWHTTPDVADLDILAATNFTVVAIAQPDADMLAGLVTKRANLATGSVGWNLWTFTGGVGGADISDGTNEVSVGTGDVYNVNERHLFALRRNVTDDKVYMNIDATKAEGADTTTLTIANALAMSIGAFPAGGDTWFGRVYGVAVWRRAFTDAQLLLVENELVPLAGNRLLLLGVP